MQVAHLLWNKLTVYLHGSPILFTPCSQLLLEKKIVLHTATRISHLNNRMEFPNNKTHTSWYYETEKSFWNQLLILLQLVCIHKYDMFELSCIVFRIVFCVVLLKQATSGEEYSFHCFFISDICSILWWAFNSCAMLKTGLKFYYSILLSKAAMRYQSCFQLE